MNNSIIDNDISYICQTIDVEKLSNSTVVLSGASGLIGTYFLACLSRLLNAGILNSVYALIYSDPPSHVVEITRDSNIQFMKIDLANFEHYSRIPEADIIIHTAGYAQPLRFMANAINTLQINCSSTIALLKKLKKNGSFLFSSSAEVYCDLDSFPFSEEKIGLTTPFHVRASYIEGKRGGECAANIFYQNGYNVKSVRLGDIYGPGTRENDQRAINSFIRNGYLNKRIDLMDAGNAMRNFCYITDAVILMWKILFVGTKPIYNLGGPDTITIAQLAQLIGAIMNIPISIPQTKEGIVGSPRELVLDLVRMKEEFNKTKFVSLKKGLKNTIDWQRNLYPDNNIMI